MTNKISRNFRVILVVLVMVMWPCLSLARTNILTTGIGVSLDLNEREYASFKDDPETEVDESSIPRGEDDYRRLVITPLVIYTSQSPRDSFEIRFQPDLSYDLMDYSTDWNANVRVAADRSLSRTWKLGISNHYIRSDYYRSTTDLAGPAPESTEPTPQPTDPELSPDIGRTRYWRNTLNIFSDFVYREESLARLGFNYVVLRYDDDRAVREEDYDRYEIFLSNEHRFNPIWSTSLDLRFIRGDFEPTDPEVADAVLGEIAPGNGIALTDEDLSNDLKEYRVLFTVDNNSIPHNPLFINYNYIGSRYDEILQDNSDIHQMRFNWRRDISSRLYTILGIGPSYEKTEGRDANWEGNGIAEINYLTERGSYNFVIEKQYDVVNFDGTRQRGIVDYWDTRFSFSYNLSRNLSLIGNLSYLYEDRQDPIVALARILESGDPQAALQDEDLTELEKYHNDRYLAGIGLSYTFWQFYTARADYTFTKQESDRINDDYDDHRLLLTLSWQKDILNW